MRFIFVCAGTAGHINPAISIAGRLKEMYPESEFLFIGAGREMEKRLIPAEGYKLKNIKIDGLARGISFEDIKHNINTVRSISSAVKEAREIIDSFKPDAVIGTGGYVCYPIIKQSAKKGIPTFLHESNYEPGLANRALSGMVDKVMVAFPNTEKMYKKPDRVLVTGTPVRTNFLSISRNDARLKLGLTDSKPLVVSFWGSLGADNMNSLMADFIKLNSKSGEFHHIHATGNGMNGVNRMKERLGERGIYLLPEWEEILPYIDNMGTVMTAADLIICRSGASTLAELTSVGRASILVPSPNVTNNQQEKNAIQMEKAGASLLLKETECTGETLYNTVLGLIRDPGRLSHMEGSSKNLGFPNASTQIVQEITKFLKV